MVNYKSTRPVVPDCPQTDAPLGHAVQYPVTVLSYYGPRSKATGVVSKDAAGQYWCDGKRFSHLHYALDYAEAHHD